MIDQNEFNKLRLPRDLVDVKPENYDLALFMMIHGILFEVRTLSTIMLSLYDELTEDKRKSGSVPSTLELYRRCAESNHRAINDLLAPFGTRVAYPDNSKERN